MNDFCQVLTFLILFVILINLLYLDLIIAKGTNIKTIEKIGYSTLCSLNIKKDALIDLASKIDGINNGEYYLAKQDRTHDITIVGIYEISKVLTVSATWVYYTGNAITFPSGKYQIAGMPVNYYTERNGYRMPNYHRLDLGVTWQNKKNEKFESSWNFSLYNAYGRENAYTITFQQDPDDISKTQAVQTTLFRWVPSVTYNFKF